MSNFSQSFPYDTLTYGATMRETVHASVSHYFSSDLWHYKRQPASLAYTQAHMYMHAHAHTHWLKSTQHHQLSAQGLHGFGRGWGGFFGIKLSVVGRTGDETTGEVRRQLLYRVIKPVTESFSSAQQTCQRDGGWKSNTARELCIYCLWFLYQIHSVSFILYECGTLRAQQELLQDDMS